jgi:hypothetical protein
MGDRDLAVPSADLVRVYEGLLQARATLERAVTLGAIAVRKEIDAHLAELAKLEERSIARRPSRRTSRVPTGQVVGFVGPAVRVATSFAARALAKWGPRALIVASGFGRVVMSKLKSWALRIGKLPRWAKVLGTVTVASELGVLEGAMRAIGRALGSGAKGLLEVGWPVLLLVGAVVLLAKR